MIAILDTACQRSVCGVRWLQMAPSNIQWLTCAEHEVFKFGLGKDTSTQRLAMAVSLRPDATRAELT
eukprot:3761778-Amphidinium_carterae.1